MAHQVTCLGILVADIVGKPVDRLPERGQLNAIDRIELHSGGCAANTGVALAKLGVQASVIGKVGPDALGDYMVSTLRAAGVGVQGIIATDPGAATSATMVLVDSSGERSFLHAPGANDTFTEADIEWDIASRAPLLHIAGPFLMTRFMPDGCADVLRLAKERYGLTTTLDTVWDFTDRWMDAVGPSLPYIDYMLPSLDEARRITGRASPDEIAGVFFDRGVRVAVGIKLGAQGAFVRTRDGRSATVPPLPAGPVVDSLGAGDAWAAGFLCGLTRGWPMERCARFANAVGACSVQALGATTGIRGFDETYAMAFGSDAEPR